MFFVISGRWRESHSFRNSLLSSCSEEHQLRKFTLADKITHFTPDMKALGMVPAGKVAAGARNEAGTSYPWTVYGSQKLGRNWAIRSLRIRTEFSLFWFFCLVVGLLRYM